jgi:transcriptional regulator with PAS, ATPase and Fis domain
MEVVYQSIIKASASNANVVIYGESGTGKELVARTIHQRSARHEGAFVAVNCGAVSESLFEREFFGHRKGAFTGADQDRPGFFDQAHKGTLFLDEVGELPPPFQVKLLQAIEEKAFIPVGDTLRKTVDVRIIAATNRDLGEQHQKGLIREDFFYRIHVILITLPPLRDRTEDIPLLVDHFLKQYSGDKVCCAMMPGPIIEALCKYDWPGNVRQLQNELQRYLSGQGLEFIGDLQAKSETKDDLGGALAKLALPEALEALEKRLIVEKLTQHQGNTLKTADVLGVSLRTLQRKIKKYRIENYKDFS